MTIMIEVTTGIHNPSINRFTYADSEVAAAAQAAMAEKVGLKFTNDPEKRVHTLVADDGVATFLMEEVVSVRLIDHTVYRENTVKMRAWCHQDTQNEAAAKSRGKSGYSLEEDEE